MATPTEHYREAERLQALAGGVDWTDDPEHAARFTTAALAGAQVHATLALAGATLFAPSTHMPYPPNEALRLAAAMGGGQ